jgi:hypothetical protein
VTRERVAAAYPGKSKVGLSLWVIDDGRIVRAAVGSVALAQVGGILRRFAPDLLLVPTGAPVWGKAAPFAAHAQDMRFVHPRWADAPLAKPTALVGALAQNAWRMGYQDIVRDGPYRIGSMVPDLLNTDWLERHGPRRLRET